jgi:hypothetical protein
MFATDPKIVTLGQGRHPGHDARNLPEEVERRTDGGPH